MAQQRRTHRKPMVYRRALAEGDLRLRPATLVQIRRHNVAKGDPISVAEVAGLQAMKRTADLIPFCHTIPLTGSRIELAVRRTGIHVRAEAETVGRTGVEMESLVGASVALLTVWDMVKYLEKNARGLYPTTRLGPVRVVVKEKRKVARE
ncbi:MAG: cyclic pyranopterin monophosphate synthase MoaC [Thermoplasmata archaeon]